MPKDRIFAVGQLDEAKELVRNYHYSGFLPMTALVLVGTAHEPGGLWGDCGVAVAVCAFRWPPARWKEDVLELCRLVRNPNSDIDLTWLISSSCKWISKNGICDLLVSYADSSHGHHGGVYQASSWLYSGIRRSMDGIMVDGMFVAGRTANNRWGTRSPEKVSRITGSVAEGHYDTGKHLYWRALSRSGKNKAERLGLKDLPYPKPDFIEEVAR